MPPATRPKRVSARLLDPSPDLAPSASSRPAKRPRDATDADDDEYDPNDFVPMPASMPPPPRKSKRGKTAAHSPLRQAHSDPVEGSSSLASSVTPAYPPPASVQMRPHRSMKTTSPGDAGVDELAERYYPSIDDDTPAARALARMKTQLDMTTQQLHQEQALRNKRELQIRQDMMLPLLKKDEALKKTTELVKRYQAEYVRAVKEMQAKEKTHAEEKVKLDLEMKVQQGKVIRAECEGRMWREEVEHAQTLQRVLEEDMDELRRIENEEVVQRREKAKKGELPPAYGSLDDEAQIPPYETHAKDSGALEVATFKRTVREKFMKDIAAAQNDSETTASLDDPSTAHAVMLKSFCASLADAARNLDEILRRAKDVANIHFCAFVEKQGQPEDWTPGMADLKAREYHTMYRQQTARSEYVADRIAKLILDLTYRLVAALEVKPYNIRLTPAIKAAISLSWTAVDTSLSSALRRAFNNRRGSTTSAASSSKLMDLQLYLTQIQMLQSKLHSLFRMDGSHSSHHCTSMHVLDRSWTWVVDQVEKERELLAKGRGEGLVIVDLGDETERVVTMAEERVERAVRQRAREREGSAVSSVPARPGSRDGSEEVEVR
ncbi:hypothetical protein LTR85_011595 [Meristemomyces frigidus]|nr:hypothetical protein LTR85_011595 [Meristemomyces frigidus]